MLSLDAIRIVMIETSLSANIGSAARAMKTMGLSQLFLVNPVEVLSQEAYARSSGARNILESATVVSSLDEAIGDCSLVVGASARSRSLPWPLINPRQAAEKVIGQPQDQTVAILFGRESSGLSNEELARCQYHVHIPANPDYSSLNIAAAIQVIGYELRMAALADEAEYQWADIRENPPADQQSLEGYFQHLEQALVDIGYLDPNNPKQLMPRLRRLYLRSEPDQAEINILRGILKQTLIAAGK